MGLRLFGDFVFCFAYCGVLIVLSYIFLCLLLVCDLGVLSVCCGWCCIVCFWVCCLCLVSC